ncbi:MAG: hypothetical protein K0U54_06215 [Bacteroidetes bacterium]|nr:hypothetical protein [Bacteroidota bacterium]
MRYLLSILGILLLGCVPGSNYQGNDIINKSILAHGSWDAFLQLDTVTFKKTTRLFLEDGSLEVEKDEAQVFSFLPTYSVFLSNDTDYITYKDSILYASVRDSVVTLKADQEKLLHRIKAAEFVFFQPFKLKDLEAEVSYTGSKTIMDSIVVSEVQVNFPNSKDTWWFYFDDTYLLVANKVFHNNRYSFIENLEFQRHKGLLFNKHRKSYIVDSLNNKKYLRAEYFYGF